MSGLFPCIPIFEGFLIKKGVTKWRVCGSVKNALLPLKSLLFLWKGVREFGVSYKNVKTYRIPFKSVLLVKKVKRYKLHQVATKHTTSLEYKVLPSILTAATIVESSRCTLGFSP